MKISEKAPTFNKKQVGIDIINDDEKLNNPPVAQILQMWNKVERQNIEYRENTFTFLKRIVYYELLFLLVLILINCFAPISPIIISSVITGVIVQTFGLVWVVVKYLFNNKDDKYLEYIAKIAAKSQK